MADGTNARSDQPGWLAIDPAGQAREWYGPKLAGTEAHAWRQLEADDALRQRLVDAGWTIRQGPGWELFPASLETQRASA